VDGQINLPVLVREDLPDMPVASRQKKITNKIKRADLPAGKKRIPIQCDCGHEKANVTIKYFSIGVKVHSQITKI
jgi:hypothetical protein